jgi:DNA-binding response OmpR family regulator
MQLVLIVDDDPYFRKLVAKILEKDGYETMTAPDGNVGLKTFKAHHPDLTIVDMIMPEKEGLETIMALKRIDPQVKIIAISGGGKADPFTYLQMAKKLGAAETLVKPLERHQLLEKVTCLLSDP